MTFLTFTACEEEEKGVRYSDYEIYSISVDQNLLDNEAIIKEYGVQMHLPKYWNDQINISDLPEHYLEFAVLNQTELNTSGIALGDEIKNAYLLVSSINNTEAYKEKLLENYETMLNPDGNLANLNRSSYQLNDVLVHHYFLQTPQTINIKLFVERGAEQPFQLDFVLPAYIYHDDVDAIRSSIGTLKKQTQ